MTTPAGRPPGLAGANRAAEGESERPLLTVAVVAYAQEAYVAEAVRAALAQTYTPLEIIVSDDKSPDRTFEIMKEVVDAYRGPHKVILNRNEKNLRLAGHINFVVSMARGELVAIAAGDDISDPERMTKTWEAYEASGRRALSVFGNAIVIDQVGTEFGLYEPSHPPEKFSAMALADSGRGVLGCTHSFHRSLFDVFGPLHPDTHSEDIVLPFRAALLGEVIYVDEVMARYRLHDTNRHFRDPSKFADTAEFFGVLRKMAPDVLADFRTRLRDLDTLISKFPERAEELEPLHRVTALRLEEFQAEHDMLMTESSLERLRIIFRAIRKGTTLRRASRWILTFFLPRLYLKVQAKRSRKASARPE